MAFTLEDGTGVAAANAYVAEATVTTYLTDRGRETENGWSTLTTAQQQQAIVKATDYVEKRFRGRWKGAILLATQGLSWPRTGAYDNEGREIASDAVPTPLQAAISEYAVRAAAAVLLPDPAAPADNTSGVVTRIKQKAGPVETDVSYRDTANLTAAGELRQYPAADLLLEPLMHPRNTMFAHVGRA